MMGSAARRGWTAVLAATLLTGVAIGSPAWSPAAAQQASRANPSAGFADLAERLLPAVVNISTTQIVRADREPGQRSPGEREPSQREPSQREPGQSPGPQG